MAILSVVAYTALGGQTSKARNSRRVQDLSTIQSAIEIYFIENNNKYPLALNNLVPSQMPKIPTDPSSDEVTTINYAYSTNGPQKEYQLATTLETEADPYEKAYVTGNATSDLISGYETPSGTTACVAPGDIKVKDNSTTCVPYNL